jgi:hypothetical protein
MVEFTKTQLQRLGNLEDKEFSIRKVAGENGHQMDEVVTKQRWFGGRLARHHKIQWGEDRTAKRGEYVQAKLDVLDSLRRIYGTEIGERAFKAHIGRTIDGVHQTSADHPITGRHIQKMLKTAERDLRQQIVLQKFNRDFRDSDGKVMSEHATAAWMVSKSVGLEGPDGQRIPFSPNVTGWNATIDASRSTTITTSCAATGRQTRSRIDLKMRPRESRLPQACSALLHTTARLPSS